MQITQDTNPEESTKNSGILIPIADVDLFSEETTLSWQIEEPNDSIITELFERRLLLMCINEDDMKIHAFRVLSKVRIGIDKFCVSWMAKVEYLRVFHLRIPNLTVEENQICFFHGRFTFWRVHGAWRARIC